MENPTTVRIELTEHYPFPVLNTASPGYGTEVEVEADTLRRWLEVAAEWRKISVQMVAAVREANLRENERIASGSNR